MKITQPIISDLDETDKESLLRGDSFDISPCNSFTEDNRMFIGHDYGAAVYVRAVQVDVSDKITADKEVDSNEKRSKVYLRGGSLLTVAFPGRTGVG